MDEREDIQKKTFGKWINSQLSYSPVSVTDLYYDLRDGLILLTVLEQLTEKKLKRERGSLRVHHLSNVSTVLRVLQDNRVKLVNINNVDIVDGNPKITLALVWSIILHWQFNRVLGEHFQHMSNLERSLLAWCRQSTLGSEYAKHGVDVRDFTHSWKDGLAILALLHNFKKDLFDFHEATQKSPVARLELAFDLIQKELGITRLLDPEDLHNTKPDKKSVMTYIMCIFQVLPHDVINMDVLNDITPGAADSDFGTAPQLIGSPLKTPIKTLTNGKMQGNSNIIDTR